MVSTLDERFEECMDIAVRAAADTVTQALGIPSIADEAVKALRPHYGDVLRHLEEHLYEDTTLVQMRMLNDTGNRHDLADVIAELGHGETRP